MVVDHCSEIYDYASNGQVSKPNTLPSVVRVLVDDYVTALVAEETKDLREEMEAANERCEALEQEKADFHMAYRMKCDEETKALHVRCEALTAERDQFLAAQQADQDRFARDISTFASGYTQALDDHSLKGKNR
jgi:hypothetical protein